MRTPKASLQSSGGGSRHACLALPDERPMGVYSLASGRKTPLSEAIEGAEQGRLGIGKGLDRLGDMYAKGLGGTSLTRESPSPVLVE